MRAGRNVNQAWQVHTGLCWNLGLTKVSQSFALEFTSNETKRKQKISGVPKFQKAQVNLFGDNSYWATEMRGGKRTSVGWFLAKHEMLILPPEVEDLRKVWVLEISGQGWESDSHSSWASEVLLSRHPTLLPLLLWPHPSQPLHFSVRLSSHKWVCGSLSCLSVYNTGLSIPHIQNKH